MSLGTLRQKIRTLEASFNFLLSEHYRTNQELVNESRMKKYYLEVEFQSMMGIFDFSYPYSMTNWRSYILLFSVALA